MKTLIKIIVLFVISVFTIRFMHSNNIIDVKTKKISTKLTAYIYFVLRCLVIIKDNKLDIGVINRFNNKRRIIKTLYT